MFNFGPWTWVLVSFGAFTIGLNKTAIPSISLFYVPLMATLLPAKVSTGFILPMLVVADFFAIAYYRQHADWKHLGRLLPAALVGLLIGYVGLSVVSDRALRPIIGGIVLLMIVIQAWRDVRHGGNVPVPKGAWFSIVMGLIAGITTMMANAAGPVMALYLLAMRLPKERYMGTGAWYFLIVNLLKVPLSLSLGFIGWETLRVNALLIPAVVAGALLGVSLLKVLPQKIFRVVVQVLAAAGAIQLLI
jgi:uncharacterized membrane protein YfcA